MNYKNQTLLVVLALFCTYFIWGSTYLAIRFGIESFQPFLMAGLRFTVAGVILYIVMRLLGSPNPTRKEWLGAIAIGILLPANWPGLFLHKRYRNLVCLRLYNIRRGHSRHHH